VKTQKYSLRAWLACTSIAFGASLTPGLADAASQWAAGPIAMLYPMGNGSYVVALDGVSAPNCGNAGGAKRYFYIATGQNGVIAEGFKSLVATTIAAFSLGKPIAVVYDDGSASCFVSALTVE